MFLSKQLKFCRGGGKKKHTEASNVKEVPNSLWAGKTGSHTTRTICYSHVAGTSAKFDKSSKRPVVRIQIENGCRGSLHGWHNSNRITKSLSGLSYIDRCESSLSEEAPSDPMFWTWGIRESLSGYYQPWALSSTRNVTQLGRVQFLCRSSWISGAILIKKICFT